MQEDIRRYLGYSAEVKIVPTLCYVLTIDSTVLKNYGTLGGRKTNNLSESGNRYLKNRPVSDITEFLNNFSTLPVVDESAYSNPIDLTLSDQEAQDLVSIKSALSKYGIYLKKSTRLLNNFFIYYHQSN